MMQITPPPAKYEDSFQRLARLQGSDPAFFVLAVHSFMEGLLRATFPPEDRDDDHFGFFLMQFREHLLSSRKGYIQGLDVLNLIRQQHDLTNGARHRFEKADPEDARAATQHLRRFCSLAGIPEGEGIQALLEYLAAWEDRRSRAELIHELRDLGYRYQLERRSAKEMTERLAELEKTEAEAERLKAQIQGKDRAIAELEAAKGQKDKRVGQLRGERAALAAELKSAHEKAEAYDDAQAYLDRLSRMTVLTRTRADYEKTIIRLTPEQKKVLDQIRLDSDFLVKGSAGTGKTLVLLKAIEKAKHGGEQAGLGMEELAGSVALLTYNHTLVKYDRYLAAILSGPGGVDRIQTADAFIRERLAALEPGAEMDYEIVKRLAVKYAPEGIDPKVLEAEGDSFIWANDVTREEYLDAMMDRRGMKKPLVKAERELVWTACEAMACEMTASRRYGKEYSRVRLLRLAEANPQDPALGKVDYVFVDEAQDLSAAGLKAIKACARRALILAGDADQSIYQSGFSFRRAGIDVAGRSRILKLNFRNTVAVHDAAERYRATISGSDAENEPVAFRDGPAPELFEAADRAELAGLLAARVDLFVRRLGYDPENICVLVPLADDIPFVQERLKALGYLSADIRAYEFDFASPQAVRVSTFHSAKGLDFPVVFLFLYRRPYAGSGFDDEMLDTITRNLIYVAMTRAMDSLSVFTLADPKSEAIKDLKRTMEG